MTLGKLMSLLRGIQRLASTSPLEDPREASGSSSKSPILRSFLSQGERHFEKEIERIERMDRGELGIQRVSPPPATAPPSKGDLPSIIRQLLSPSINPAGKLSLPLRLPLARLAHGAAPLDFGVPSKLPHPASVSPPKAAASLPSCF